MRDTLFGDLPLDVFAIQGFGSEPWLSFQKARASLTADDSSGARKTLESLARKQGFASLYRLQAWHSLREHGGSPPEDQRSALGVVVEVGMEGGLDVLAAYDDRTAQYCNFSGSGVVWTRPDRSLDAFVDAALDTANAILPRIGLWKEARRAPPSRGQARLNILTPQGLHFGEGSFEALSRDPLSGPLLGAATNLMRKLTSLPRSRQPARRDP